MKTKLAWLVLAASMVTGTAGAADRSAVVATYGDIAHAAYEDSLITARALHAAIGGLTANPGDAGLIAARRAWLAARAPYQQTEVFRFGNAIVDEWEGKVNAWPLDEGLIDYVAASYGAGSAENSHYVANVIANPVLTSGGRTIDAARITKSLLSDILHEADKVEANVATGYHAIEFLLWGQDLNGTGPGAGNRPATDFSPARCTGGNCDRRTAYLTAAVELLVDDLAWMTTQWAPGGSARAALADGGTQAALTAMIVGLGSLSYGELAGERMKLGLMLHDPEEEQDCFSDNTHNSHYFDQRGIINVYTGHYRRIDGGLVSGPSLADMVAAADPALNAAMLAALDASEAAIARIVAQAEQGQSYDQLIGPDNPEGNAIVHAAIDALAAQTQTLERVATALNLGQVAFEGSDSLDDPTAVFQ